MFWFFFFDTDLDFGLRLRWSLISTPFLPFQWLVHQKILYFRLINMKMCLIWKFLVHVSLEDKIYFLQELKCKFVSAPSYSAGTNYCICWVLWAIHIWTVSWWYCWGMFYIFARLPYLYDMSINTMLNFICIYLMLKYPIQLRL